MEERDDLQKEVKDQDRKLLLVDVNKLSALLGEAFEIHREHEPVRASG